MSDEEILKLIDIQITNVGATGMQDIGKVMGPIMGKLKGRQMDLWLID